MRPLDLALFADENIHPDLIGRLRGQGKDVRSVHDDSLAGASDVAILHHAREQSRVVLTHDRDFAETARPAPTRILAERGLQEAAHRGHG
jgi:predicted nuclease of predicted toxin-antitoxin system